MSKFIINGGQKLSGSIPVFGSKNAALPLLSASLLTGNSVSLHNIPDILDVRNLLTILAAMGATIERHNDTLTITAATLDPNKLPTETVGLLRGSILLMGALLGRFRTVTLPRPGGDLIGARPIDVHLDGFAQLGARISEADGTITIDGTVMRAGKVTLREFSVTATENVLLAAATLPGTTTISIAACEPHVVALANLLNSMGAKVAGAGTHTVTVEGNSNLTGATITNTPDMLEAGSLILLAAATKSDITVTNVPLDDLALFFKKLDDIGIRYNLDPTKNIVNVHPSPLRAFKVQTMPHPGIAADLQALFTVVATQAEGSSLIHDPLYEGRFRHIPELQKMGASVIVCDPHRVIIHGPTPLHGQTIPSLDIRSGITLLIAGLTARGQTVIEEAEIIDRGYANLTQRLQTLGADIQRDSLEFKTPQSSNDSQNASNQKDRH